MSHLPDMTMCSLPAFALACLAAMPVAAKDKFQVPITGDILTGWVQPDGTRVAAIRLKLAPGWKTYWRTPGDAGIPPLFDWSRSDNLYSVGITWPAPEVFMTAGMRTIGYTNDVILPIALAPRVAGEPISLKTTVDLGVCSDICVPHRMELSAELSDTNSKPTPPIAAALAARPYSASEAGVSYSTCALRPTQDGLQITTTLDMPSAGGSEVVIIEPGQAGLWMSETDVTRDGSMLIAVGEMMTSDGKPVAINRSEVKITVLGKKHAVEITGCAPG